MKRTLFLVSALAVMAALCSAQDDAAYSTAMKDINANNRPLRTAVMGKDVAAASAAATKIAADFDVVVAYWTAKKVDDATKFATTARDAAKTIAAAKDADAQNAALTTLSGTCNGCHMAHRAGSGGAFSIK